MNDLNNQANPDDEVDLFRLIATIWAGKWWIVAISILAGGLTAFYSLQIPNIYRVEAKISAVGGGGSQVAGLMAQYGGLASLAGIAVPPASQSETGLLLEILQSRDFVSKFIKDERLEPRLLALLSYDPLYKVERLNQEIYDQDIGKWLRKVNLPRKSEPSEQELYDVFLKKFEVKRIGTSQIISISFEHQSPLLGFDIVSKIIQRLDDYSRQKDKRKFENAIEYLAAQLSETRLVEVERVLYQMIESHTKKLMLAEVNSDYAFQVIDRAYIPEKKSGPRRSFMVISSSLIGALLGGFFILILAAFRKHKRELSS
ncbi:Wzz/FepE/Etk N-terminal domain-containing protein [Litorivicinus sp.]|nr:Wzz/FepE/Etk N-terminal domain-containing protein [Litorivicinus sp.]MDC1239966.1 Wzz/FepE/Etk N-terminal domain-containing protein [Litorivicinus sp.]